MRSGAASGLLHALLRRFDDHVRERGPGRDHREDVVLLHHLGDDDHGTVVVAEVVKEDSVFPWIPSGAPISQMMTERPKHRLEKPSGST